MNRKIGGRQVGEHHRIVGHREVCAPGGAFYGVGPNQCWCVGGGSGLTYNIGVFFVASGHDEYPGQAQEETVKEG